MHQRNEHIVLLRHVSIPSLLVISFRLTFNPHLIECPVFELTGKIWSSLSSHGISLTYASSAHFILVWASSPTQVVSNPSSCKASSLSSAPLLWTVFIAYDDYFPCIRCLLNKIYKGKNQDNWTKAYCLFVCLFPFLHIIKLRHVAQ